MLVLVFTDAVKIICATSLVGAWIETFVVELLIFIFQMSIHIQNGLLYTFGIILNGSIWLFGAAYESMYVDC